MPEAGAGSDGTPLAVSTDRAKMRFQCVTSTGEWCTILLLVWSERMSTTTSGGQPELLTVEPSGAVWRCAICGTVRVCPMRYMSCTEPYGPMDAASPRGLAGMVSELLDKCHEQT
jgi:hypothetical protein